MSSWEAGDDDRPFGFHSRAQNPCNLLRNDCFIPVLDKARSACRSTLPSVKGAISVNATLSVPPRTTKRPDWWATGVGMAYKLLDAVQARWQRLNGHALVRVDAEFVDRKLQEGDDHER